MSTQHLKQLVLAEARAAGFDAARVTTPAAIGPARPSGWRSSCAKAGMATWTWMATTAERRGHPTAMWPEARSIVMLGMNYAPDSDPLAVLGEPGQAAPSPATRNAATTTTS